VTTWSTIDKSGPVGLSNGNLTATSGGPGQQSVRSTTSKNAGLIYWENTLDTVQTNLSVGFANAAFVLGAAGGAGSDSDSAAFYGVSPPGSLYCNNLNTLFGPAATSGEIVYFALNFTLGKYWVSSTHMRAAGTPWNWGPIAAQNPATGAGGQSFLTGPLNAGPYFALFNDTTGGAVVTANFGASAFDGAVPAGYTAWDVVPPPIVATEGLATSEFYAVEIGIFRGFTDPVGPADMGGWLTVPWLALSAIEASASTTSLLYVSDSGYRTRADDLGGVIPYPPRITGPLVADVSVNLDPVQSSVAAAWGTLVLSNMDHFYDDILTNWTTDGQGVTIYRGVKTLDSRGILVDPQKAALAIVFRGVLGPMVPGHGVITMVLRDASYFLEDPIPRVFYGGTGAADGTTDLVGVSQPVICGGAISGGLALQNIAPQPVDPANLVYQFATTPALARSSTGAIATAAYDGGAVLILDAFVPTVYAASPAAGHWVNDPNGLVKLGSTPVFQLTLDACDASAGGASNSRLNRNGWNLLAKLTSLPADQFVAGGGTMVVIGVDPAMNTLVSLFNVGTYVAAGEDITGVTFFNNLVAPSGGLLVPCRDGWLRLLALSPIPAGTTSVLTLDDSNIISIEPVALPDSVNPPPARLSLGYGRNWTVQTALAGAITAARRAFVSTAIRTATSVGVPSLLAVPQHQATAGVIAPGGSLANNPTTSQAVVNNMTKLWGVQRRLYEITVPSSVGLTLDWASVVNVVSDFDGLQSGKQGQVVGWRISSEDMTAMFRVLV